MLGEKVMLVVLGLQMFRGLLSLDDIPPQVTTARQEVMMNVQLLREGNHAFFIDVAIRWKSLLSELRAALKARTWPELPKYLFQYSKPASDWRPSAAI